MKKILSFTLILLMLLSVASTVTFASDVTYEVGDIVTFGSYPQSRVTDKATVSALKALAPEWSDWNSYGYYSGNVTANGTMEPGDWMRYIDISYEGNMYRGVEFHYSRPNYTEGTAASSYQDDNGYSTYTDYWFKYEPIEWRILDPKTGFVLAEKILDSQAYNNTLYKNINVDNDIYDYFNDLSYTVYANDYEASSIRNWLNNDFYNTAFSSTEKDEIFITHLNNDSYYTLEGASNGYPGFDSNDTNDKVFLLSYGEINNDAYVLNSKAARKTTGSDYAKCQGLLAKEQDLYQKDLAPCWILRTPGSESSNSCYVSVVGAPSAVSPVYSTDTGVRPALRLNLEATEFKSTHNHIDGEEDNRCDNCGEKIKQLNFLQEFFIKIKLFFKKLFGIE